MVHEAEVVIVGGGIHGACAGYHLAKAGKQVVLVEKGTVGSASSGASGGIIRSHYSNEPMVRVANRAARLWPHLEAELGAPVDYVRNGLIIAVAADDARNMERIVGMQRRVGVETGLIDPEEISRWIPQFDVSGLSLAAYEQQAGYADPYAATVAFANKARELGMEIYANTAVTGIDMNGSAVRGVITDRGSIRAPLLINCAGPWAARVAAMAGIELPVEPGLLQMVAFSPRYHGWNGNSPTWVDMTTMTYCRPDAAGLMLAGGGLAENASIVSEVDPDCGPVRPPAVFDAEIHDNLIRRCPWAERMSRVRSWSGPDGNSPDFHLIIGPVPGVRGYLQIVGGSGNSFKLAPATGEAIAEYVTTGRCSYLDLHAFGVTRFTEDRPFRGGYQMHIVG